MDFDNLAHRALVGAAIGGGLVCLIIALTVEFRFFFEALMLLGSGGLLGGSLCGIILGTVNKRAGVVIGGLIGGLGGCAFVGIGTLFYASVPWPSPEPYPGVETHIEFGSGSWGPSRVQTYTSTLSLDAIQHYYEAEMSQHCANDWQFENSSDTEYQLCREAACSVPRLGLDQYFRVSLCSVSEKQTFITHVDSWQD